MYILYPEEFWQNTELKNKHVKRMRLNTIKTAVSFLKSFKGTLFKFNQQGDILLQRYKAYNTLISYECNPLPERIEVKCDKIPSDTIVMIKYMSYFTK